MTPDDPPQPGWAMNRRTLMSLIGLAVAAATVDACSSDGTAAGTTRPTATDNSLPSGGAPSSRSNSASTTSAFAHEPATNGSPPTGTAPALPTPTTDTAPTEVASTDQTTTTTPATTAAPLKSLSIAYPVPVDTARLQQLADSYNGEWSGNWAEESGGTGELNATITIDATTRTVTGRFSYSGPLLQGGAGTPELLELTIPDGTTPEKFDTSSEATGDVVYTYEGGTTASLSAGSLPGNARALSADLALLGDTATASYSVMSAAGQPVLGAGIVARNRVPAPIDLASIRAGRLTARIASGSYAADLLTPDEMAAAIGAPINGLIPNGGNVIYQLGIQTSNVRAESVDGNIYVQITIYRADDLPTAYAFWVNSRFPELGQQVPGYGAAAIENQQFFGMFAGNLIAQISVGSYDGTYPIDRITVQHNIAAAMLPRMITAP